MANKIDVARLPPLSGCHTHTFVFLHGRGDNTANFISALDHFRDSRGRSLPDVFPTFKWVFPQAPMRKCASIPETWPQWFDVWDPRDFSSREVIPEIRRILHDEATELGGRWDRLILAGISMGAATSVHTLFNLSVPTPEGRLGAFLGFCCRCPFAGRSLEGMREVVGVAGAPSHNKVLTNTPMLQQHCVDDPLVPVANGRGLRDVLTSFGANVTWKEYPNGGHWFNSPAGADDVVAFLQQVLKDE